MTIRIVTPAPPGSRRGNRVTAGRWARLLRGLGHRVIVEEAWRGGAGDLLIALHAGRSAPSVARFRAAHPERPIVVALTGTDLYDEFAGAASVARSLEAADRLVVLQPLAIAALPRRHRRKARAIYQSVETRVRAASTPRGFSVCAIGHLRPVKAPLLAAAAARRLPARSRIQIVHVGSALSREIAARARTEAGRNPRWRWIGELPRWRALRLLARSRALVLTSRAEGGAHVISEACAVGVPVLSTRIDGSVGLLGAGYPGYFPVGDAGALAALLERLETDARFRERLRRWCARLGPRFAPARERRSWARLLHELGVR